MGGRYLPQRDPKFAAERAHRADEALALRIAGASYAEIGRQLGMTESGAWKLIQNTIARIPVENANELRRLAAERLDQLCSVLYPKCMKGDVKAIATMLQVEVRRARLLGLDLADKPDAKDASAAAAPTRIVVTLDPSVAAEKDKPNGQP